MNTGTVASATGEGVCGFSKWTCFGGDPFFWDRFRHSFSSSGSNMLRYSFAVSSGNSVLTSSGNGVSTSFGNSVGISFGNSVGIYFGVETSTIGRTICSSLILSNGALYDAGVGVAVGVS